MECLWCTGLGFENLVWSWFFTNLGWTGTRMGSNYLLQSVPMGSCTLIYMAQIKRRLQTDEPQLDAVKERGLCLVLHFSTSAMLHMH